MSKYSLLLCCLYLLLSSCHYGDDQEIIAAFNDFKKHRASQDSVLARIDHASFLHFSESLDIAKKESISEIRAYISESQHPLVNYKTIINAKYIYLTTEKDEQSTDEELLEDFIFFNRFSDMGLWGVFDNDYAKSCHVKKVKFKSSEKAIATIVCTIGTIKEEKERYTLTEAIIFHKEENHWKINIPSALSLSENRLKISLVASRVSKKRWIKDLLGRASKTSGNPYPAALW